MSNFDIAIGLSEISINRLLVALFDEPTAKNKFFRGNYSDNFSNKGSVSSSYEVKNAPTVTLSTPDTTSWDAAIKKAKDRLRPTKNCFQIHFSSVSGSINIDGGTSVNAEGSLDVYLIAAISNGVLSFDPIAVYFDTSSFSELDKWLIPNVIVPIALDMAGKILGSIKLPTLPSYEGITFQDLKLAVVNRNLITFTGLTSNNADLSLAGFDTPNQDYYTLMSPALVDAVIQTQIPVAEAEFEPYKSGEQKVGNDLVAWAKGTYDVNLKNLTASVNTSNPTQINVSIKADIKVSGSAGGILPAIACPIGAALNAF